MKSILLLTIFALIACVTADNKEVKEFQERLKSIAEKCKTQTKASDSDMEDLFNRILPTTRVAKCFRACIMRKLNFIDSDGKLNKKELLKVAKIFSPGDGKKMKIIEEVIDACKDIRIPRDRCEGPHRYNVCLRKESKKRGIELDQPLRPEM